MHVGVAAQEAAAVGHLTVMDVEAVHQGHSVKPVVEAEDRDKDKWVQGEVNGCMSGSMGARVSLWV
jgi:hypothetical protein